MEAVNLDALVREGGTTAADTLFIGYLVIVGMKRIQYIMLCREMRDWLGAGESRSLDDAVRGVCSTQCMQYAVYAVLGVNS